MNNWSTIFPKPSSLSLLKHGDKIVQLGSCFSTSISERLREAGFGVVDNTNGVIFHPIALGKIVEMAIDNQLEYLLVQKEDVFLDFYSSSSLYGLSETELLDKLLKANKLLREALQQSKLLTITFGSAHAYRHKESSKIVANCHQQPGSDFIKECTSVSELVQFWEPLIDKIKKNYPDLKILATVSPVRYSRDGWVENARSKAHLIELCSFLETKGVLYFPSYELIIDLLRDFRYFEKDGVHPNSLAVDEVWELFRNWFFSESTNKNIEGLMQLRAMENHRLLYPESKKATEFLIQFNEKRDSFLSLHKSIIW